MRYRPSHRVRPIVFVIYRRRPSELKNRDADLPEIPETSAIKSGRERVIERARRDYLTVRQLAQIAGS